MEPKTETETRLERLLSGCEYYHFKDRMRRHYRVRRKTFQLELERRNSAGEWVFDGFVVPNPKFPNTLHLNTLLGGAYVEVKIDLNQVHILDDHE